MGKLGPNSKYFRLCRTHGLHHNYLSLQLQCKSSHRQYVNKCVGLCSNKTLFMDTNIWISYNFHMSWSTLLIFFNHFKMEKPFLAHRPNRQWAKFSSQTSFLTPTLSWWSMSCKSWTSRHIRMSVNHSHL